MNKQFDTRRVVEHRAGVNVARRNLLKLTGVGVAVLSMMSVGAPTLAQSTLAWDKTFPKSERVDHRRSPSTTGSASRSSPTSTSPRTSIARGGMPHSWLAGPTAP